MGTVKRIIKRIVVSLLLLLLLGGIGAAVAIWYLPTLNINLNPSDFGLGALGLLVFICIIQLLYDEETEEVPK
jgi:hypothetical protein